MDRLILFLDFDGTLTPIVPCPNRARLGRSVRKTLWKLIGLLPVVVISGRTPADLRRRVGLRNVCYVGHHGLSCLEAEGRYRGPAVPRRLDGIRRQGAGNIYVEPRRRVSGSAVWSHTESRWNDDRHPNHGRHALSDIQSGGCRIDSRGKTAIDHYSLSGNVTSMPLWN